MNRGQKTEDRRQRYLVTRDEGRGTRDVRHPSSIVFRNLTIIAVSLCFMLLSEVIYAASPVARDIQARVIKDTQNSTLNRISLQASDTDAGDVLTYTILSLPAHGQLKDEAEQAISSVPYALSSNKLKYIPASGYIGPDSFTYKANDGTSDSNTATVSLNIVEWFAPIGIPEPEFGIKETYRMYDDPAKRNPALPYTQNTEGGFYTHYVDNTHPAATDTGNAYGTASVPRITIPTNLIQGSVVEIHGNNYGNNNQSDSMLIKGAGTREQPVFIRGLCASERPVFTGLLAPQGTYVIVENLYLYHTSLFFIIDATHPGPINHVALRDSEFEGTGISTRRDGMGIHTYTAEIPNNVVIYNNHVHHYGDYLNVAENDAHGIGTGTANHVWVADNHIHHNGGDSIQVQSNDAKYIYIGRNEFHHNRENAVDIKQSEHVIISENDMYGFVPVTTAAGDAVVVHYTPTQNIWITHNRIHDSQIGISCSTGPTTVYITNNIIECIAGTGITFWNNGQVYVVNNTIYNATTGLVGASSLALLSANNIISNIALPVYNSVYFGVTTDGMKSTSYANYTLFHEGANGTRIIWGGGSGDYNTFEGWHAAYPDASIGSVLGDPCFVDTTNGDFRLTVPSPAIDAGTSLGVVQEVFDRFQQLYGIDIRKDIDGNPRPQGSGWDIGAYEYTPSSGDIIYGDVSGDVEVSAYDAALTAQAAVGLITLTAEQTQKADVSGDAEISAYDAALIAQYAVGLISKFPVEGG